LSRKPKLKQLHIANRSSLATPTPPPPFTYRQKDRQTDRQPSTVRAAVAFLANGWFTFCSEF